MDAVKALTFLCFPFAFFPAGINALKNSLQNPTYQNFINILTLQHARENGYTME